MTEIIDRPYIPDIEKANKYYGYKIVNLDLTNARTNFRISMPGNFLQVFMLSIGASIQISFNRTGDNISFDGEQHIFIQFTDIYITNTAQPGASVSLFIGNGVYFVPSYRTIQVSPSTSKIKSYAVASGAVATALSAVYGVDFGGYAITRIDITNDVSGNDVFFGDSSVSDTNGMPIVPGQFYSLNMTPHYLATDLYHISPAGSTLKIIVYGVS